MIQHNPTESPHTQTINAIEKDIEVLKLDLLQNYLNGSLILGTILFFVNLYISVQNQSLVSSIFTLLLFGMLFVITFLRKMNSTQRMVLLCIAYFGTGIFSLLSSGLNSNAMLYFFIAVLILGIFGTRSWWISGLVVVGFTAIILGLLVQTNVINPGNVLLASNSILNWVVTFVILLFLIYVILTPTNKYLIQILKQFQTSRNNEVSLVYDNSLVAERVHALESEIDRRRSHLISGRQIIKTISEQNKAIDVIMEAADLIKSQFGYYFVGIYLKDEFSDHAILQAATGAAGKAMLSRNHRVGLRESTIGYVISRGESRIALDVSSDLLYTENPDLLETKSELVIPLKVGNTTIGALDIHSEKENAFSQQDVDAMQNIADQLIVTFDKARQFENLRLSLESIKNVYASSSQASWRTHLQGSKNLHSYQFSGQNVEIKDGINSQEMEAIREKTKIITTNDEDDKKPSSTLLVPIMLRDQALGVMNIRYEGKSIPKDLEDIVEATSTRLAVALENARLIEDIQDRADRERIVGSISNKVRSARDIDSILQTTVSELGKSLGVNEIRIHLKTKELEQ